MIKKCNTLNWVHTLAVLLVFFVYIEQPSLPKGIHKIANQQPDEKGLDEARWYQSELGLIVAPSTSSLSVVADIYREMVAAQKLFNDHFGTLAGQGIIYDVKFSGYLKPEKLESARWILPWDSSIPLGKSARKPLRHEISHMLFVVYFWPNTRKFQYGGDAPDWLDEIAAISAEDEKITDSRRYSFREAYEENRTLSLSHFFAMEHPLYASKELKNLIRRAQSGGSDAKVLKLSAEQAKALKLDGKLFYAQARAILDFLKVNSGSEHVLQDITLALKGGQTMDGWLASLNDKDQQTLGRNVLEMEKKFLQWIVIHL